MCTWRSCQRWVTYPIPGGSPTMRVAHLTALSLSALAVAASGTALAGTGAHPAQPADPAAAAVASGKQGSRPALTAVPDGLPRQYESLQGPLLAAPDGQQTRGTLACTTGKLPLGGGVLISSNDVQATVNSSFPNGGTWIADVNNSSGSATTFRLFVIC